MTIKNITGNHMTLEQFKTLVAAGELQAALESSDLIKEKDRYFFYEKAKAQLALLNYRAAVSEIDSVLAIKSDWLGAHAIKVTALLALELKIELMASLFDMINNSITINDRYTIFKNLFDKILDSNLAEKMSLLSCCLEYYRYVCGQDGLYLFFSGVVDSNRGYYESASKKFGLLDSRDIDNLGRHATGALSFRFGKDLEDISSGLCAYKQNISILKERSNIAPNAESIIMSACDSAYFEMFSDVFISSFCYYLKNKVCHIHVVNPTDAVVNKAEAISRRLNNVNFSFEWSGFNTPAYFAISRFVILEQIMDFYGLDVLVCDIDAAFVGEFSVGKILSDHYNIVVKADNKCNLHSYPWRGLAAGFFAVKNNYMTTEYIRSLKSFVMSFILDSPHKNIWYFDQTAIYCLLKHFTERSKNFASSFIYGETSKMIVYPNFRIETKEEFVQKHMKENFLVDL